MGNVVGVQATLPARTDNQAFCYDDLYRLVWAASVGASPAGCAPNSPTGGTLTSASYYGQSFAYDTLDRLAFGPLGGYTYGDAAHLHAATAIGTGASAFSVPDDNQPGTTTNYANERTTATTDALGNTTTTALGVECGWAAPTDTSCYTFTSTQDAAQHQTLTETDGWGRTVVTQADSGTGTSGTSGDPYAVYAITTARYDDAGRLVRLVAPDYTHTTSFTYDTAGRQTGMSDPDRGTESYTYDPNGNLTHASDARGQLVYTGYDGINRPLWRNTSPSPSGAYVSYSYDSTAGGNLGIGYLTGESFSNRNAPGGGGGSLSGSYAYTYDTRGQTTSMTQTLGGTGGGSYSFGTSYDDAGQPTSLTYPDGAVLSLGEDASSGWPTSAVTTPSGGGGGGAAINLATGLSYSGSGNAGAAGAVTSATIGNGVYTYAADFDGDLRPTSASTTLNSDGATLFSSGRTYDALGNVTSATTTLPAGSGGSGTDTQAFCYDDLSRLIWAGTSGTPPCSTPVTPSSSVAGASYQQSVAYDNLNRLTSGPLGSYTYGDAAHLHAATAIGSSYSASYDASYDASGNMLCRAPTSATCSGSSPTGQQLTYDTEGNLVGWQDAPSNPTSTATLLYDGEGDRVEQVTTNTAGGGTSTTTRYLAGGLEEIATTGSTTQITKYYPTGVGGVTALSVATNGGAATYSYLASDGLGSVSEALSSSGAVTAQQLYAPYGGVRYSSGALPGSLGYTGQQSDGPGGLAYYGARYYDPLAGQFTSADTVLAGGLNRYAYVGENPETATDPTGHVCDAALGGVLADDGACGGEDFGVQNVGTGGTAADGPSGGLGAPDPIPVDPGLIVVPDDPLLLVETEMDAAGTAAELHAELIENEIETAADENAVREAEHLHPYQDEPQTPKEPQPQTPKQPTEPTQPTTEPTQPKTPTPQPANPTTPAQQPSGTGGTGGTGGFSGGTPPRTVVVTTPNGISVPVPGDWPGRIADNGKGVVFQQPGAQGNANMVRIMDPTALYPDGYMRYYNSGKQPLDINGFPGNRAATHIPLGISGTLPGYYRWLGGFVP